MPKVTVVVPVYCSSDEHEEFLRETLRSIAAQTFRDFETVIVVEVYVLGGYDEFLKIVLDVNDGGEHIFLVVVVNIGDGAGDFVIVTPFRTD